MAHSRPTPQQIITDLPLEAAREATWQGFFEANVQSPVIDAAQNLVVGTVGDGVLQAARTVSATFEHAPDGGTLITFSSRPVMGGVIETGKAKLKKAEKVAAAVEAVIARGWTRAPQNTAPLIPDATAYDAGTWNDTARVELSKDADSTVSPLPATPPPLPPPVTPNFPNSAPMAAPISAPGAPEMSERMPNYGAVMPTKQGTTLLIYGVLGMLCCQILAPFTVYYSTKALQTYGELDPGDKTSVKIARILGIIGCIFLVLRLLSFAGAFSGR